MDHRKLAPWKFGLDRDAIAPLAGNVVTIKGTTYRGNQTMLETKPEWIQPAAASTATAATPFRSAAEPWSANSWTASVIQDLHEYN